MSLSERREMIRKDNTDLSLTRQCKLLKISRSSIYYTPVGFDQATIDLMHEIDRIFTKYPFFGSRQIAAYLPQSGSHHPGGCRCCCRNQDHRTGRRKIFPAMFLKAF